jgi:hypothetical protein
VRPDVPEAMSPRSITVALKPRSASSWAAAQPVNPAPMMIAWGFVSIAAPDQYELRGQHSAFGRAVLFFFSCIVFVLASTKTIHRNIGRISLPQATNRIRVMTA